ncbi:MAG: hypothetical protein M1821_007453 [Bathelium mastoideum]|nr:MAG: hypothetical protein M1821_007453 [Bathelium mastoideum]KAI9694955.1 MAG: hypothetical protein M1822_000572 [Bathelium mastoideum]
MTRRGEYQYDPVDLDDTGAAPSQPPGQASRSFGGFRQFIQALQTAAAEQDGRKGTSRSWGAALLLSFLFNVVLVVALAQTYRRGSKSDVSEYAQLPPTRSNYEFNSFYGAAGAEAVNEKKADGMWEAYSASGVVAIPNSNAEAWQLPAAEEFPWDKDYSLYAISGMHSLQCLKNIRRSTVLAYHGGTQGDDYAQLLHCFDVIRQDIICHADDTLMYTPTSSEQSRIGEGQSRICRDWNKLEQWFEDNSACFAGLNETEGVADGLEHFKYCPKDSKFAPTMRAHFGLPADWYEEPPNPRTPS